jgi:hypothetical protein
MNKGLPPIRGVGDDPVVVSFEQLSEAESHLTNRDYSYRSGHCNDMCERAGLRDYM